ncbi:YlqD family protein [Listeria aquatica]|uniref:YlqD family protein n=1 Tax=Listeria aquatica TaxID=1494960 RepID=UPI003EF21AAE
MQIVQKITVKQVLTKKSRAELLTYYSEQRKLLEKEREQLLFEQKKVEHKNRYQKEQVSDYFEQEMQVRKEKIKLVDFQMEQLEILPLGSEIREREMEAILEISVGDRWDESFFDKTIVVTDGIVTEIR